MTSDKEMMRIDVDEVLRKRMPRYYRHIPKWLTGWLKRTIHQDELNAILQHMTAQPGGVEAADAALSDSPSRPPSGWLLTKM